MKRQSGFTLLESAMVLGFVAVVAAGIMATRNMIRNSQIQSIMSEQQMYATAIQNFKTKYLALPGDFSSATALWGEVSSNCKIGAASGTQTCNGNGNSVIQMDGTNYEHIIAWRHLGLSKFINQNFSGNTVSGGSCNMDVRANVNVPASKLKGAMWNIGSSVAGTPYTGGAGDQYMPMNVCTASLTMHILWLGGAMQDDNAAANSCAGSQIPVLTAREAYQIDTKFDDKRAISGKIRSQYNNVATYSACEDSGSSDGGYRTSNSGVICSIAFVLEQ